LAAWVKFGLRGLFLVFEDLKFDALLACFQAAASLL